MRRLPRLTFICLVALFLITIAVACNSKLSTKHSIPPELSNSAVINVNQVAKEITILIDGQGDHDGSGFIVSKQGSTYYVLTAWHVVSEPDEYSIITPDGKRYQIEQKNYNKIVKKIPTIDLALLHFTSSKSYTLPEIIGNEVAEASTIFVAGFPKSTRELNFTEGLILSNNFAVEPLKDGYNLIYSNETSDGMSGGPVLDKQARIIGVHGRAELFEGKKSGYNLGIPIQIFVEQGLANSVSLRLVASNRLALIESSFNSLIQAIVNPKKIACSKSKNDNKITYHSLEITSPDGNSSVHFEDFLKVQCIDEDLVRIKAPVKLITKTNKGNNQIEFPFELFRISDFPRSAYRFINPISFSPGGRYLVVELKDGSIHKISSDYAYKNLGLSLLNLGIKDFQLGGRDGHLFVIDFQTKVEPLQLDNVCREVLCRQCRKSETVFQGFKSSEEIAIGCATAGRPAPAIVNLGTRKGATIPISSSSETDAKLDYPSYGSISSLSKIIKVE